MQKVGYTGVAQYTFWIIIDIIFGSLFYNYSTDIKYYESDSCEILKNWGNAYSIECLSKINLNSTHYLLVTVIINCCIVLPFNIFIANKPVIEVSQFHGCKSCWHTTTKLIYFLSSVSKLVFAIGLSVGYDEFETCGKLETLTMAYMIIFWTLFGLAVIVICLNLFCVTGLMMRQDDVEKQLKEFQKDVNEVYIIGLYFIKSNKLKSRMVMKLLNRIRNKQTWQKDNKIKISIQKQTRINNKQIILKRLIQKLIKKVKFINQNDQILLQYYITILQNIFYKYSLMNPFPQWNQDHITRNILSYNGQRLMQLQKNASSQSTLLNALSIAQNLNQERQVYQQKQYQSQIFQPAHSQNFNQGPSSKIPQQPRPAPYDRSNLYGIGTGPVALPLPLSMVPQPLSDQIQFGFDFAKPEDGPHNANYSQSLQDLWLRNKSYLDPNRKNPRYYQDKWYLENREHLEQEQGMQQQKAIYQQLPRIENQQAELMIDSDGNEVEYITIKKHRKNKKKRKPKRVKTPEEPQEDKLPILDYNKQVELQQKQEKEYEIKKKEYEEQLKQKMQPQKQVQKKKKKFRLDKRTLRIIRIRFTFLALYIDTLRQNILAQKQYYQTITKENMATAMDSCHEVIEDSIQKEILELLNFSQDLQIQIGKDDINRTRAGFIVDMLTKMITNISKNMKPDNLGREFYLILTALAKERGFPPNKYYLDFEIDRLHFTRFGALIQVSPIQENMLVVFFVVLRNFLQFTLLQTWKYHPNQENTEKLFLIQRNALIMGSIMHYMLISYYEKKTELIEFDWNDVNEEDRIESIPFIYDPEQEEELGQQPPGILIADIMAPSRIKKYIDILKKDKKQKLQKLQAEIVKLGENIQKDLNEVYEEERGQKERMIKLMEFLNETKKKVKRNKLSSSKQKR